MLLVAAAVVFREYRAPAQALLRSATTWIHSLGPWAPLLFVLFYAGAAVCCVPGSVLTLSAGALFGLVPGILCVSAGATLGATVSFLIGRHWLRDWVGHRLKDHRTFQALNRATAVEGWKIVGLCRLSPLFPFAVVNYGFALTQVPLLHYVIATLVGILPSTVAYAYLGALAGTSARADAPTTPGLLRWGGLAMTLVVTLLLVRMARRALANKLDAA